MSESGAMVQYLLRVEHEVTVSSDPTRPATDSLVPSPAPSWGRPYCLVVVQVVGQVVLDEIFARYSQIHWVPVGELTPQLPG